MTPALMPDGLAATHAAAFGGGWPVADFANYLLDDTVEVLGTNDSFIVIRRLGPEAEILTLATHPDQHGKGHATRVLQSAMEQLRRSGVETLYLDVADDNVPARALYDRCGFAEFARRRAYYKNGASAICMKLEL